MKSQMLAFMPLGVFFAAAIGCSANVGEEATDGVSQEATSCPASSATDDQQRAKPVQHDGRARVPIRRSVHPHSSPFPLGL